MGVDKTDLEVAFELLRVDVCPNCDGSGCVPVKLHDRQYVSREMAVDAGEPSMEGSLYCGEEWEQEQCQWCDERKELFWGQGKQLK